jgi:acyl dehydratase
MSVTWDSIHEGDELPTLETTPGVTQLVKYAAGSGDFNPLHHDYGFPQSKQLGSIIVHGRFKYAVLGELVSNWLGHNGRVRKIGCQYRGMDKPDRKITAGGSVTRKFEEGGQKCAELSIWTQDEDGRKTTPGEALVVFD